MRSEELYAQEQDVTMAEAAEMLGVTERTFRRCSSVRRVLAEAVGDDRNGAVRRRTPTGWVFREHAARGVEVSFPP